MSQHEFDGACYIGLCDNDVPLCCHAEGGAQLMVLDKGWVGALLPHWDGCV